MMSIYALLFYLLGIYSATQAQNQVLPLITPRSSSTNLAREMIETYQPDHDEQNSFIFITPEIIKSFHPQEIAETLFGSLVCNPCNSSSIHCSKQQCSAQKRGCRKSLIVSGSQVANRRDNDWLADYCGLPTDFQSIVSFGPQYTSTLIDIGTYISLNRYIPHSYLFVHAPIEHSWWNLRMQELIVNPGTNSFAAGYFDSTSVIRDALVSSFSAFAQGAQVPQLQTTSYTPLAYAKMSPCHRSISGISDVEIILGCNPIDTRDYTYGAALRISIPGGHTPEAHYLFEPLIGAADHYKLGLELSGHVLLWHNRYNNESATLQASLVVNHLFNATQHRTFDLKCSPLSRYMLAQKVDTSNVDNFQVFTNDGFTKPQYIFANTFEPVANLSTTKISSKVSVECEFSCMISFNRDQFSWHIGYDFWIQSREHLTLKCCRLATETWALKGDAQVFGFLAAADGLLPQNAPIALSATQSQATITSGTNATVSSSLLPTQNPGVDTAAPATAGSSDTRLLYAPGLTDSSANQIDTSATPVLLSIHDLDIDGARISHKANKLFMHMNYALQTQGTITPSIGVGGEVDFGTSSSNPIAYTCSFWGVWVYIGARL